MHTPRRAQELVSAYVPPIVTIHVKIIAIRELKTTSIEIELFIIRKQYGNQRKQRLKNKKRILQRSCKKGIANFRNGSNRYCYAYCVSILLKITQLC